MRTIAWWIVSFSREDEWVLVDLRFDGEVDDENIKLTSNPLKNNYTISPYTELIVQQD